MGRAQGSQKPQQQRFSDPYSVEEDIQVGFLNENTKPEYRLKQTRMTKDKAPANPRKPTQAPSQAVDGRQKGRR
jgi:hypothetical protein